MTDIDDLVTRLRALAYASIDDLSIADEAADEIERLRVELDALKNQKPVAWATYPPTGCVTQSLAEAARWKHKGWDLVPLYAAPKPGGPHA